MKILEINTRASNPNVFLIFGFILFLYWGWFFSESKFTNQKQLFYITVLYNLTSNAVIEPKVIDQNYYVSIGLPLYNEVRYLEAAILSALNQTMSNIQIVIYDDGSTDGSYEMALRFAKNNSRIKLVRSETNMGTYVSRREVAYNCDGDYIFQLDPDDLMSPSLCEIDYKKAIQTGADLIIHQVYSFRNDQAYNFPFYNPERNSTALYDNHSIIKSKFMQGIEWVDLKSKFTKRTVLIEAFKLVDEDFQDNYVLYAEDRVISGALFLKVKIVVQLPYYLYYYRVKTYDTSYMRASRKNVNHQMDLVDKRLSALYGIQRRWTLG